MHQPAESRKYQIFPPKDKPSLMLGRPEWDSTSTSGQSYRSFEKDRSKLGSALRLKAKDQPLLRRRKISMTEIGAMTTVQEMPMDSRKLSLAISNHLTYSRNGTNTHQRRCQAGHHFMSGQTVRLAIIGGRTYSESLCLAVYLDQHLMSLLRWLLRL
jgi:hypothetical protein